MGADGGVMLTNLCTFGSPVPRGRDIHALPRLASGGITQMVQLSWIMGGAYARLRPSKESLNKAQKQVGLNILF